jgi:uncharacterized membrane protein YhaH (DUF805 family)
VTVYLETFEKAFRFDGRATRREYWTFIGVSILLGVPIALLDGMLGLYDPGFGMGPFTGLYFILIFVPSLSLSVRRLHDIDFNGWWFFVGLIPFVGGIIQLILSLWQGTPGPNRYGAAPGADLPASDS